MESSPGLVETLTIPDAPPLSALEKTPYRQDRSVKVPPRPEELAAPFPGHDWTVSTHVFCAAFPRVREPDTRPHTKSDPADREGLRLSGRELNNAVKGIFARQRSASEIDQLDTPALELQSPLQIAVNRYAPKQRPPEGIPAVTIVLAHANGLHKETWEPTLMHMLNTLKEKNAKFTIAEIWSMDTIDQGDSAILNADVPGMTFSWDDSARDIVQFVSRYLPKKVCTTTPPYELVQHPTEQDTTRRVIGIGHSLGSACMASAAATIPHFFKSLILVDTTMIPTTQPRNNHDKTGLTAGALVRRDVWRGGREEAAAAFRRNKGFFGRWDPAVLDRYIAFALHDSDQGVGLKCHRETEALVFADPGNKRALNSFGRLALLPPSVQVHFIFAGNDPLVEPKFQDDVLRAVRQSTATANSIAGAGHLIPQEKPDLLGREVAKAIGRHLKLPLPPSVNKREAKL